jgi:hypothetical protein
VADLTSWKADLTSWKRLGMSSARRWLEVDVESLLEPLLDAGELLGARNPYLEAVRELGWPWRRPGPFDPVAFDQEVLAMRARQHLVEWYAWAIPDERALELVGATGEVVEVGAGGGYWAAMLRGRGVRVHAYDRAPGRNYQVKRLWSAVERGGASAAGRHPEATLLLCWPPYDRPFASLALERYRRAGGGRLVYIGEHGGCTADETFQATIDELTPVAEHSIPQWPGIHDYLSVYELA